MSVLQRDLDAYQRALAAYRRTAARHNAKVRAYQNTLVQDAEGRYLVAQGGQVYAVPEGGGQVIPSAAPGPLNSYGFTELPDSPGFHSMWQNPGPLNSYGFTETLDSPGFYSLRQNPSGTNHEKREDVLRSYDSETGAERYYVWGADQGDAGPAQETLGSDWRITGSIPGVNNGDYWDPTRYIAERDVPYYMEKPGEPPAAFNRQAPQATEAAMRRAGTPSLAQIEAGLIGQVMRGKGVRY